MADPFVAEIRIFAFQFAPRGWALCNGQLLPISQNTALFSLLGTTYGGNGLSNFGLPDLQGRAVMQPGQGPGLSNRALGEAGGTETVTLLSTEMPAHSHTVNANPDFADVQSPTPARSLARSQNANAYKAPAGQPLTPLAAEALSPAGSSQPHNNMQPYLTLSFNIALQGVFPPR
ncbi:phage tail protein [Nocardioides halotolerans]|uniref:phage tail protein n=1 Tax=Nocardioides halotolerans TaxID=433660 RepID=UPI00040D5EB3|nr:tail fiber protein [Nocardioides halotolerans]